MSVTTSIELTVGPPVAWSVLSDLGSLGSWMSNHVGYVGAVPESLRPGIEYTERIKVLGLPHDVRWTVNGFDEGLRIAQEGRGPMGILIDAEYTIEPITNGARLTVSQTFSGAALPAIRGQLECEVKQVQESSLARFKDLIEVG